MIIYILAMIVFATVMFYSDESFGAFSVGILGFGISFILFLSSAMGIG